MKAIRYLVYAIIGLVVLAVAAVAIAVSVIDPNTYKPQIEQAVESSTNLDLALEGDIGWSFFPLGLELNRVEATLEDERLVSLERLVARVGFWSLVSMSPRVDTFVLEGLDARLVVAEDGTGNWTRIMPEAEDTPAPAAEAPAPAEEATTPLSFAVESIEISNASILYEDRTTGQSVTLENFTLNASDIAPGSSFPLELGFRVRTGQPQLVVDGSISARLSVNEALNAFAISGLDATFDMSGEPLGGKSVTARLGGSVEANLESETLTLADFSASLANLALDADLSVNGFGDSPQLQGTLSVSEFSLKALLEALGQPAIATEDPDVLTALGFSTSLGGPAGTVALTELSLNLDDTRFTGSASYGLANGSVALSLQGDTLNADRYLPPASEDDTAAAPTSGAGETGPETDLLPLETLRNLVADIDLGLGQLVISNLTISEIKSRLSARGGMLRLEEFSGQLYQGSFNATASLDARSDNPKWVADSKVNSVQSQPLLMDLAELDMLSGGANLSLDVSTTGNRVSVLRENASGTVNFNLAEGEFTRLNLTRMACQGIAMANGESLSTTDWGTSTPFNDMRGTLKIDGNTLNNTELVAALAGMKLEGNGSVNLAESTLNHQLGLRIVGEIHRDNACRVTEYVKDAVIPVECRGNFSEDPAGLCSFDGSRFRDTLKDMAASAAKAKASEEVEKAKEKATEKATQKLQEKLGEEGGKKASEALKGLFGQ